MSMLSLVSQDTVNGTNGHEHPIGLHSKKAFMTSIGPFSEKDHHASMNAIS